jgi:hypothetical protein
MDLREERRRLALDEQRQRLAANLRRLDGFLRHSREYEAERERLSGERPRLPSPDVDWEALEEVRETVVLQFDALRLLGG